MLLAKQTSNPHLWRMNYRITFVESEEGVAVWCDDLPGCASQGATRAEAEENIKEAIALWLDVHAENQRRDAASEPGVRISQALVTV
jgi:predicted RNase H-like HicB family nuclease